MDEGTPFRSTSRPVGGPLEEAAGSGGERRQGSEKESKIFRRRSGPWLVLILCAAGLTRLMYLEEIKGAPDFAHPALDAMYHDYWARGLATGRWDLPLAVRHPAIDSTPYFRPPGYPYFLALVYRIFGTGAVMPRIVQMLLGMASALLAYWIGRRWFGSVVGLIFAGLMSTYWSFIYFEGELLEPALLSPLTLAILLLQCRWAECRGTVYALLAGLSIGLFALIRPNIFIYLAASIAWMICWILRDGRQRHRWMPLMSFVLAASFVIAPVGIRNWIVSGDYFIVSSNGGINFFFGNNAESDGFTASHSEVGSWSCFDYPRIAANLEREYGRRMSYGEVSRHFVNRALAYIRENPIRSLRLTAAKSLLFWGPVEVGNEKEDELEREASNVLRLLPMRFAHALTLAQIGLALFLLRILRRRRTSSMEGSIDRNPQIALLSLSILFLTTYSLSFLPFIVAGRYRVPIVPILLLWAAAGLHALVEYVAEKSWRPALCWIGAALCLGLLNTSNLSGYQARPANRHWARAVAFRKMGQFEAARREYEEVFRCEPRLAPARLAYANLLASSRDWDAAEKQFRMAIEIDPTCEAHRSLAHLLELQGRDDDAMHHYSQALRLDYTDPLAHYGLGGLLMKAGSLEDACSHFREALKAREDFAEARSSLQACESLLSGSSPISHPSER